MSDSTFVTHSNLTFVATRFENKCEFRCEAINDVMKETHANPLCASHQLDVWYPPLVFLEPDKVKVIEGAMILLRCAYIGNPSSIRKVIWYRNGERLNASSSRYHGGTVDHPTLTINKALGEDMGEYSCLLANIVGNGTSNKTIEVNVLYKPQVRLNMSSQSPILETDHLNVTLTCEVMSGNPHVLDEVIWYLDGEVLKHLPECNDISNSGCSDVNPSMLLLQDTSKSFHGNYSCKGKNIVGWSSESEITELVVNYPPGPAKLTHSPWRVIKGQSLVLTCNVEEKGRPQSNRFLWHRSGHLVSDSVSESWTIDPVTVDHRANFSCRGTNSAGEGLPAFVSVDVLAPPSFKYAMNHYSGALYRSQNISLSCTVECAPLCSMQWLKDGRVIEPEKTDRYFVLERTIEAQVNRNDFEATESTLHWNMSAWAGGVLSREEDVAHYTCRSSHNAAGPSVSSTTKFVVEYEPENITVIPEFVSVIENNIPGQVVCSAKAFPMPTYLWYKEPMKDHDKELELSSAISSSSTLVLGPVTRKDGGNYTCVASNKHSSVKASVHLNVMFAPKCRIKQMEKNGEQVLVCSANANPSEVTFSWKLMNDNESLAGERIWQLGQQSFLTLKSAAAEARVYKCKAANSLGMSEPCVRVVEASTESYSKKIWWKDQNNLLLFVGITISVLVVSMILSIIIICVFRKIRTKCKQMAADDSPRELDDREKIMQRGAELYSLGSTRLSENTMERFRTESSTSPN